MFGYAIVLDKDRPRTIIRQEGKVLKKEFYRLKRSKKIFRKAKWAGYFPDHTLTTRGILEERPSFAALLEQLQEGDAVVVTTCDRIFLRVKDMLKIIQIFQKRGVTLCILQPEFIIDAPAWKVADSLTAMIGDLRHASQRNDMRCMHWRRAENPGLPWHPTKAPIGWRVQEFLVGSDVHRFFVKDPGERRLAEILFMKRNERNQTNITFAAWCRENKVVNPKTKRKVTKAKDTGDLIMAYQLGFPISPKRKTPVPPPPDAIPLTKQNAI